MIAIRRIWFLPYDSCYEALGGENHVFDEISRRIIKLIYTCRNSDLVSNSGR